MTVVELGNAIRERRVELGLTQTDVAAQAGTSRRWLIELEAGHPNAQLHKVLSVLHALELDVSLHPASQLPPARTELDDFVESFVS
ncbi:MAG: helix-turn-helix domain-containing protein [Propionibacteriaceae bacterium]|nr:helix-turn-helix domain-containing protein [Propionibacteriaceae bacterium]